MSNEVLYNNQVISFLEELWGDGFLSPGGSDEVKKVLKGIKSEINEFWILVRDPGLVQF